MAGAKRRRDSANRGSVADGLVAAWGEVPSHQDLPTKPRKNGGDCLQKVLEFDMLVEQIQADAANSELAQPRLRTASRYTAKDGLRRSCISRCLQQTDVLLFDPFMEELHAKSATNQSGN